MVVYDVDAGSETSARASLRGNHVGMRAGKVAGRGSRSKAGILAVRSQVYLFVSDKVSLPVTRSRDRMYKFFWFYEGFI